MFKPFPEALDMAGSVSPQSRRAAPRVALPIGQATPLVHQQVLLVDDDAQILEAVALRLQAAGYETTLAHDGSEVTNCVALQRPHAIVLDVRMPHCDGLQMLAILRASAETRSIPVVMLSASLADRQRALQAGARFFLEKPYAGNTLIDAVRRAIAESLAEDSPQP